MAIGWSEGAEIPTTLADNGVFAIEQDGKLRNPSMTADAILRNLREHEAELRAAGVERTSLFGSRARGQASGESDIDLALRFSDEVRRSGSAMSSG